MKNINYDLIKLLLSISDDCWRLQKFYIKDAQKAKSQSIKTLRKILKDKKQQMQMLIEEIENQVKSGKFD